MCRCRTSIRTGLHRRWNRRAMPKTLSGFSAGLVCDRWRRFRCAGSSGIRSSTITRIPGGNRSHPGDLSRSLVIRCGYSSAALWSKDLRPSWVFPSPRSKTGHLNSIKTAFKRARKLAGLPSSMVLYTARDGNRTGCRCQPQRSDGNSRSHANENGRSATNPDVTGLKARLAAAKTIKRVM